MPVIDPFTNDDSRWEKREIATHDQDLSMPDLTPTTLKAFLRSTEGQLRRHLPPQSQPNEGRVLGHITGFP
jgi:hypothetical protein